MDSYSGQEEFDRERCASGSKRGRMAEVSEGRGSRFLPHGVVWFLWFPRFCGDNTVLSRSYRVVEQHAVASLASTACAASARWVASVGSTLPIADASTFWCVVNRPNNIQQYLFLRQRFGTPGFTRCLSYCACSTRQHRRPINRHATHTRWTFQQRTVASQLGSCRDRLHAQCDEPCSRAPYLPAVDRKC